MSKRILRVKAYYYTHYNVDGAIKEFVTIKSQWKYKTNIKLGFYSRINRINLHNQVMIQLFCLICNTLY